MARPIQANAERTRARILETAGQMFSARGVAPTTMRAIARQAGVTMATVHHYFGGKADLYQACIDAMYDELTTLREELEVAFAHREPGGDVRLLIDRGVRTAYAFARKHRRAVQLMVRTLLDTGQLDPDKRERYLLPFLAQGQRLLADAFDTPPATARVVLLSLNHLITRYTLSSADELALIFQTDAPSAVRIVEDYLVDTALAQLTHTARKS